MITGEQCRFDSDVWHWSDVLFRLLEQPFWRDQVEISAQIVGRENCCLEMTLMDGAFGTKPLPRLSGTGRSFFSRVLTVAGHLSLWLPVERQMTNQRRHFSLKSGADEMIMSRWTPITRQLRHPLSSYLNLSRSTRDLLKVRATGGGFYKFPSMRMGWWNIPASDWTEMRSEWKVWAFFEGKLSQKKVVKRGILSSTKLCSKFQHFWSAADDADAPPHSVDPSAPAVPIHPAACSKCRENSVEQWRRPFKCWQLKSTAKWINFKWIRSCSISKWLCRRFI